MKTKKTLIVLLIATLLTLAIAGCAEAPIVGGITEPPHVTATPDVTDDLANPKDWGEKNSLVAETSSTITEVYINFPTSIGLLKGTGKIAEDKDMTVIFDAQRMSGSPEVPDGTAENAFPPYFLQTKKILERFHTSDFKDFDFTVSEKIDFSLNGYDMTMFFGTHTYTKQETMTSVDFAACATKTEKTGAFVYWMVIGRDENVKAKEQLQDCVLKMAATFSEM